MGLNLTSHLVEIKVLNESGFFCANPAWRGGWPL